MRPSTKFAEPEPEPARSKLGRRSVSLIGNTPLLRLERIARDLSNTQILGKAEWYNPGGSVKDRAAFNIVKDGRRSGKFAPGKTLLDSTSGNTGIAYAMIGAAEGFPVTLCMPENVSVERKRILFAYGATIIYTDPADGSDGAIRSRPRTLRPRAGEIFLRRPVFEPRQLAGSLPWHSQRNLATDRGTYHPLPLHDGHQWHLRGHRPPTEGTQSERFAAFRCNRIRLSTA